MNKKAISLVLILMVLTVAFAPMADASSNRLLRQGSRGSDVRLVQQKLNTLGYSCGKADGIFGPATSKAVRSFQGKNGLAVDGIVGAATRSKLYSNSSIPSRGGGTTITKPSKPVAGGTTNNAPITGVLRKGSRGSQVRTLQNRLNELAYNCGKADGIFGGATYNAVVRFQRAKGLGVDGIVGRATTSKLYETTPAKPAPTPTPTPTPTPKPDLKPIPPVNHVPLSGLIRQGDRGCQVTILQNRLNELGYNCGKADGIFGGGTYKAVVSFQRANALSPDGIVGKATIAKLYPQKYDPGLNDYKEFDVIAGSLKGKTVIIDPGHGGSDSGASRDGNHEKTFTLDMSKRLQRMLNKAGAEVIMTREGDIYRTHQYRVNAANEKILDEEIKRVESKIPQVDKSMQSFLIDVNAYERDIASLTNQLGQLENRLKDQNKLEISGLNLEESTELEIQIQEKQDQVDQLEKTLETDQLAIDQAEEEIQKLENELTVLEEADNLDDQAIKELQDEIGELQANLGDLQEKQILNEQTIKELKDQIQQNQTKAIGLQETNQVSELEEQIANKKQELNNKKEDLENLYQLNPFKTELAKLRDYKKDLNQITTGKRLSPANKKLVDIFDRSNDYEDIIFISIHNNSTGAISQTGASGIRVYYRPTIIADNDGRPDRVYYDGYNDNGRKLFAEILNDEMQAKSEFSQKTNRLYGRNDLAVLRQQNLVSALVEVGFINNPNDLALLKRQQTREDLAAGIYNGIGKYFQAINKQ